MQNHLLQALAVLAAPPGPDVRAARLAVLRAARALGPGRRARYGAGRLAGGAGVSAYAQEAGVDPARRTETAAELVLALDLPGWERTRVVLRAGKALDADRKGVLLHRRDGGRRWVEPTRRTPRAARAASSPRTSRCSTSCCGAAASCR